MCSIIRENPGPEVTVKAFAPPQTAPCRVMEAANSSSIWMKVPPTIGTRAAKRSTTSVEGVMGYPAANLAPAANAPSQQAWSPSRKWVPVNTPRGSACMARLARFSLGLRRLRNPLPINREVGTVHPTEVAAAALFRSHDVGRMVALGVESRGEREHLGGTELHAESACFAALNDDGNTTFCHGSPTRRSERALHRH